MPRYIDADVLYRETEKRIDQANKRRMVVYDSKFLRLIEETPTADVVEVVRCKDCDVPHNSWTGCTNLNGMIPPPEFFCAFGVRNPKTKGEHHG